MIVLGQTPCYAWSSKPKRWRCAVSSLFIPVGGINKATTRSGGGLHRDIRFMAVQSIILGTISGISEIDYKKLKKDLSQNFEKVAWKNNTLFINSSKKHEHLKEVAAKIADCVAEGEYGSLLFVGNNRVVCIYLGHKRFVGKQYREPIPPEWWGKKKEKLKRKEPDSKSLLDSIKKFKL